MRERHSVMMLNAAALGAGAVTTAVLGFGYWWLAARTFPAEAVGFAAAAVSMMNLLALVAELGMGTLLMGEAAKIPSIAPYLISAALLSSVISGGVIGLIYIAIAGNVTLGAITATGLARAAFISGLALTAFTLVLDQAFVGILRAPLQMFRTVSFAAVKMILLCVVAWAGTAGEFGIFGTWIGGQLCSLLLLCALCVSRRQRIWYAPKIRLLRPLIGTVLRHHLLSIVIQAPGLVLPFIVTVILSARTNAAFYAAWTLVNVFLLMPASLTSVLYSIGAREPDQLPHRLKMSLAFSTLALSVASVALIFLSDRILGLFNPAYPGIAGTSLKLLGFGTLGVMIKYHYVVVRRLQYRMVDASITLGVAGSFEVIAAIVGARRNGLLGLTEGWLLAVGVEAVILGPAVLRAIRHGIAPAAPDAVLPRATPLIGARMDRSTTHVKEELSCEPI